MISINRPCCMLANRRQMGPLARGPSDWACIFIQDVSAGMQNNIRPTAMLQSKGELRGSKLTSAVWQHYRPVCESPAYSLHIL